ncbi:M20/M25/M40 family metallo-hydrolase [bacterium]|nr:M20/M25/M40 family metallo-hydrolase [bacterium]
MRLPTPDPNRIRNLLLDLVSLRSETGSYGEEDILRFIESYIRRRSNGGVSVVKLTYIVGDGPDDPGEEKFALAAVKRGKNKEGLLMVGHIDTTGMEDYGFLEPVATHPPKLLSSLRGELAAGDSDKVMDNRTLLSDCAVEDLKGEDFVWGRGTLDMKGGVAAMVETLLAMEDEDVSLALLLTPDEEGDSSGMRNAIPLMGQLLRREKIRLVGVVGTDFWEPAKDAPKEEREIHMGVMGKVLVGIYYRGPTRHAAEVESDPLPSGLLIGSAIVQRLEGCKALREDVDGEPLPPPLMLRGTDLRDKYDTTVPGEFWGYLHVPTMKRKPAEVLEIVTEEVDEALKELFKARVPKGKKLNSPIFLDPTELVEKAYNFTEGDDLREFCREKFLDSALYQKIRTPWIVVGLIPPMYPSFDWESGKGYVRFKDAVDVALKQSGKDLGVCWKKKPFYPYVTDLSLVHEARDAWIQFITAQPLKIKRPKGIGNKVRLPLINLGPSGYGAHSPEERVLIDDVTRVVPHTLVCLLEALFPPPAPKKKRKKKTPKK